jgi:hypothetical protein
MDTVVARSPAQVQDAVRRVQDRYAAGRLDAQRAIEELGQIEEALARAAVGIVAFPFVTAGAIRELYGKLHDLERSVGERDATIRALEARIRELETAAKSSEVRNRSGS